ncbi:MAG: hypothetical protein IJ334_05320, partial [Clostridia bacterium]|nr:hypothetical protein [Clostridia bacterium]
SITDKCYKKPPIVNVQKVKEKAKSNRRRAQLKFWSSFFKSSQGLRGQSPSSASAEVETPRSYEKVPLFASSAFGDKCAPQLKEKKKR